MQYYAIQCNTLQYHASLINADGAYHCPVGSIMAIFKVGALLCTENAKFWPILGTLGYFVANVRRFWSTYTGLTNTVVPQN